MFQNAASPQRAQQSDRPVCDFHYGPPIQTPALQASTPKGGRSMHTHGKRPGGPQRAIRPAAILLNYASLNTSSLPRRIEGEIATTSAIMPTARRVAESGDWTKVSGFPSEMISD